eukprot:g5198.t1
METLRFAVVGCGSIGREFALKHLTAANGAVTTAVIDRDLGLAGALAADIGAALAGGRVSGSRYREHVDPPLATETAAASVPAFESLAMALSSARDSFDAVFIGTPPASHRALTEQSLGACKHVLLEKPIAADGNDADAIVAAAEAAQAARPPLVVGVDLGMRYNRALHRMRRELPSLGRVRGGALRLHFRCWPREWQRQPWVAGRAEGGALREVGTHFFIGLHELFGYGCVTRVRAACVYPSAGAGAAPAAGSKGAGAPAEEPAEESCVGELQVAMPGGALATFALDVQAAKAGAGGDVYELEVRGEHGTLLLHDFTSLSRAAAASTGDAASGGAGGAPA